MPQEDEDDPKLSCSGKDSDQNADLNVVAAQPIPAFCSRWVWSQRLAVSRAFPPPPPSAEDSESPLDWLPMAPEIEDPEEPGWGQLEVSGRGQQDVVVGGASGRGQLDVVVGGASGGVSWMLGEGPVRGVSWRLVGGVSCK